MRCWESIQIGLSPPLVTHWWNEHKGITHIRHFLFLYSGVFGRGGMSNYLKGRIFHFLFVAHRWMDITWKHMGQTRYTNTELNNCMDMQGFIPWLFLMGCQ